MNMKSSSEAQMMMEILAERTTFHGLMDPFAGRFSCWMEIAVSGSG